MGRKKQNWLRNHERRLEKETKAKLKGSESNLSGANMQSTNAWVIKGMGEVCGVDNDGVMHAHANL